jgi:pimeloyl-ACP methyl ester carboxylesterase
LQLGAEPVPFAVHEGASIKAFVIGDAAAPHRILFVHGWSATGAEFLDLARTVVGKRPDALCVCVDLPGSGSSDKPADAPWDVPYFRSVLRTLVDAVRAYGLPPGAMADGITLIGHSLGGHLSIDYTARDGSGVARLGLISPAGWPGEIGPVSMWAKQNDVTMDLVPEFINEETYVRGHRWMMGLGRSDYSEDAVRYSGRALEAPETKAALRAVTMNALENDHIDTALGSIRVPVFLTWGRKDLILSFSYAEKFLAALPAGTRFLPFDGCGHMPHFEHVEELSSLIAGFIEP